MPAPYIRKIPLSPSQILNSEIPENLFKDLDNDKHNLILRKFTSVGNFSPNANNSNPNLISNMLDGNTRGTSFRTIGPTGVGDPALGSVNSTPRSSFIVFDLGRKIKPRKLIITLNHGTRFLIDDEVSNPNVVRGVRAIFSNTLGTTQNNGQDVIETSFNDTFDFESIIVPAGAEKHRVINGTTLEATILGDDESYEIKTLTLDTDFFDSGAYDNRQFMILEFRGSRFTSTFDIADIQLWEEIDIDQQRDYRVEFDDALLDQAGWKNIRYEGSKLTGKKINEFNIGDITYGKNPVVENKTNAIYIVDTCIGAENENEQFAFISGHSYLSIKQILLINKKDDEVQIIDKNSENFDVFQRFITSNLKTNSSFSTRIIDNSIQSNLKRKYFVKFNKGFLLKSFTFEEPFYGDVLDKNGNIIENDVLTNRSSLFATDKFEPANEASFGANFSDNVKNRFIFAYGSPYFSYDAGEELDANGGGLNGFFRLYGPSYHDSNVNIFSNKFTRQYYGPSADFNNVFDDATLSSTAPGGLFIDHFMTGSFGKLTGNVYTAQSINANDGGNDGDGTSKLGNNAFVKAVDFISHKTFNFLKKHNNRIDIPESEKTELHVTFFKGKKINNINSANIQDERSINTFEVEKNTASETKIGSNIPDSNNAFTTLPLIMFKGEAPDLRFRYNRFDDNATLDSIAFRTRVAGNVFGGPININERLTSRDGIGGFDGLPIGQGQFNYEGEFEYELSFLDKGPVIITDLDKDDELFDGIGEKGLLLIPDEIEPQIKQNIDFYLRKAGIIERKTIKAPNRPER